MPATVASPQPPAVNQPKYPLHAMTTFELCEYRRKLESAITFFDRKNPLPPARGRLQAALDDVIAGQEDCKRLADA